MGSGHNMSPGWINKQSLSPTERQMTSVRSQKRSRARQSGILFLFHWLSVCARCLVQQFHNPRPARQGRAVLLHSPHTRRAAVQQQERASAFTCSSCLHPPWGWILPFSLIIVTLTETDIRFLLNSLALFIRRCHVNRNARVYLKVFYFEQRTTFWQLLWLNTDI